MTLEPQPELSSILTEFQDWYGGNLVRYFVGCLEAKRFCRRLSLAGYSYRCKIISPKKDPPKVRVILLREAVPPEHD
jgi:hypothetical protein